MSSIVNLDNIFDSRSIRQHLREEGIDSLPLVVHCATGSGGSGAFMLSEIMLTLIEHEEVIDVQRVLTFLRLVIKRAEVVTRDCKLSWIIIKNFVSQ